MVRLQAVFALGPALLASSQVAARAVVPRESTLNVYLYEDVNNSGRQMIFIATDGGECRTFLCCLPFPPEIDRGPFPLADKARY